MELLFQFLGIIIIFQCSLYAVFLIKQTHVYHKFLAAFLLTIILTLLNIFLRNKYGVPYLYLEFISLMAPLFFLYVQSFIHPKGWYNRKFILCGIPLLAILIIHLVFPKVYSVIENVLVFIVLTYCYLFIGSAIKRIQDYHKLLLASSSNFTAFNLKGLYAEIIMIALFFLGLGAEHLFKLLSKNGVYEFVVLITFLTLLTFISSRIYNSLKNPFELLPTRSDYPTKYTFSNISEEASERHYKQLMDFMITQKPFKNGDLNLQELSSHLGMSKSALSQVINQNSGQNFNDFINSFRIEEAKNYLQNSDLLIKEVMFNSGFNSTSTFNAVFAKNTSLSPSKYRKKFQKTS